MNKNVFNLIFLSNNGLFCHQNNDFLFFVLIFFQLLLKTNGIK
jgi:hypothetical protein